MPTWVRILLVGGRVAGGTVWATPFTTIIALRTAELFLDLTDGRPVRHWMQCKTVWAVHAMA
jgi:hypothetical protein